MNKDLQAEFTAPGDPTNSEKPVSALEVGVDRRTDLKGFLQGILGSAPDAQVQDPWRHADA